MTALQQAAIASPKPVRELGCASCAVRAKCLYGALDDDARAALAPSRRRRVAGPGEHLAWQGDISPTVAIVCSGVVALTASSADGDERIVGIAQSGEFIGRPFGGPTPYGISTVGTAELCLFPRDAFDRAAAEHPRLGHALLTSTLAELDRSRRWLTMLGKRSARQKVAAFLIEYGCHSHPGDDVGATRTVQLPFTRQQIADMLGITIETVSREFTELRQLGAIALETSRKVHITDMDALYAAAGDSYGLN